MVRAIGSTGISEQALGHADLYLPLRAMTDVDSCRVQMSGGTRGARQDKSDVACSSLPLGSLTSVKHSITLLE